MNNPTVSIHTPSRGNRICFLNKLVYMIKLQIYTNIKEWVIGDGSQSKEESVLLEQFVNKLQKNPSLLGKHSNMSIVYIPYKEGTKIGGIRQRINETATGDYIICMDDDDYYPPTRVSHAVTKMKQTKYELSGSSQMYCYDTGINGIFLIHTIHNKHCTHNTLGFTKQYAKTHSYDETVPNGEEKQFLENYIHNMVQLDSLKTIVHIVHSNNTFNKREFMLNAFLFESKEERRKHIIPDFQPKMKLKNIIHDKTMVTFYKSLVDNTELDADIVYYTGGKCIQWDPSSLSLTGSEQAIKYLSTEWSKQGKKVVVYANIETDDIYNEKEMHGVYYRHWKTFPFTKKIKTLILWRPYSFNGPLDIDMQVDKVIVDLHDPDTCFYVKIGKYISKIDFVMVKSNFHKEHLLSAIDTIPVKELINKKSHVILNGICKKEFEEFEPKPEREQFRCCYVSCYSRGLIPFLRYVWPLVVKQIPQAELHCYYGIDNLNPKQKKVIIPLLGQPGVFDHGRQPREKIIEEKYKSNLHIYLAQIHEVDCITIRESLITGCVPLIHTHGVFAERDGLKINTGETVRNQATILLHLLQNPDMVESHRQQLYKSNTITNWTDVSKQWLEVIE